MHQLRDVIIIGAGPVGLFSIFECGMHRLSCHVVDILPHIGGQCMALYPEKPIYDIPGFPYLTGRELIERLEAQSAVFAPAFHLGQKAQKFSQGNDGIFTLETDTGTTLQGKALLIAAGMGAFAPKKPPLAGIEAFEGKSIWYHVSHPGQFQGKRVLIAGGGDSAVDWALVLKDNAAQVSIVHRRNQFRASPDSEHKLKIAAEKGEITLLTPYQLGSFKGNASLGVLESVGIYDLEGLEKDVPCDVLLPFFGLANDLGPLATWDLQRSGGRIEVDAGTCATTSPGVYAIGDIAHYPHKMKLILTGFSEAASAAHAIRAYLNPGRTFHFGYSTTTGVTPLS